MVCEKNQTLAGFRIAKADTSQRGGIERLAAGPFESNGLVASKSTGSIDRA